MINLMRQFSELFTCDLINTCRLNILIVRFNSSVVFCFILCNVMKVTPSPSINFNHKVSNFHFPQVFSTSSTRIKHDPRKTLYCGPCAVF